MWIYMDVHAIGLILYYEELYFNYTNRVSRPVTLCSLSPSLSFCLILVQAICYKRSSSLWHEAETYKLPLLYGPLLTHTSQ